MSRTPCCQATYIQKMFLEKNGKRTTISHEEFEKLRGSEASKGNFLWVPGIIFRYICNKCQREVSPLSLQEQTNTNLTEKK